MISTWPISPFFVSPRVKRPRFRSTSARVSARISPAFHALQPRRRPIAQVLDRLNRLPVVALRLICLGTLPRQKSNPGRRLLGWDRGPGGSCWRSGGVEWECPSRRLPFWDDDLGDASLERAVSLGAEADDDDWMNSSSFSQSRVRSHSPSRMNASHPRRRSARSSAGLVTRLRAPAADLPSEVTGVKVENRTNILEREVWLAVPALDPLLGLPAEQAGREIPGVLASSETSDRIRENRKRQPHFPRLCATTWQRLNGAGPIQLLALRRRAALKTHDGAPPKSRAPAPH